MITDFKRLSDALDTVAAGSAPAPRADRIVAEIREQRDRIDSEIRQNGRAYVTVEGRRFLVRPSDSSQSR